MINSVYGWITYNFNQIFLEYDYKTKKLFSKIALSWEK